MSECGSSNRFEYGGSLICPDEPRIRLINLECSSNESADIHFKLQDYTLGDGCLEYETLSYVWGDSSDCISVWCNGRVLDITRSLSLALQALRNAQERSLIWIDQICINQHDDMEKTHQVGLMRDIYQNSLRTIAWLGPGTDSFETAFTALEYLSTSFAERIFSEGSSKDQKDPPEFTPTNLLAALRDPTGLFGISPPSISEMSAIRDALNDS